jgi:hypothetical protein
MNRDLLATEALAQIPKILTLQDRNPHSPTYGCFDRNFWHYKIIDFPSGMAAEFAWPLALAYMLPATGNSYFQQPNIKQWAEAGIVYAARSAHRDGSCDDYFPFEKAAGAAAFSLLAALETYGLLGLNNDELLDFFARRADWLAAHHESGRLTNHQALVALCLEKAGRLLKSNRWDTRKAERLALVLAWQNEEGWFQEYEGCDPGYHTLTVGLLAQLHDLAPSAALQSALERAIAFAAHFVHPDGSFGGEYASRNTYNFFPHGFELAGKWIPTAPAINDRVLAAVANGLGSCYADDHIIGHHTWSYLLAYQHWCADRPAAPAWPDGRVHFPNAGLLVERRGRSALYLALNKGGVFKLFVDGQLVQSDTQFSVDIDDGRRRVAVAHLMGESRVGLTADQITISGALGWAKQTQMTTRNLLILRAVMLSVGRFFPDLIRKLLQKLLITGKKPSELRFTRTLTWRHDRLTVADALSAPSWDAVRSVGIGAAQTSIYVVMSRTWQRGQLQPWLDLTAQAKALGPGEPLRVERTW